MAKIDGFDGMQYIRDGTASEQQDYKFFNEQYATSTYKNDKDPKRQMKPRLIVQPKQDSDVKAAIKWARDNSVSIAVKSGGHQYSGASSTTGNNIQIDLSHTYKDLMVRDSDKIPADRALVYVGVSILLKDFNAYLRHNGLFVPTGQCAYVGVGGHGQTGGYGQLGRSFGLFGDHIRSIRLIDHNGESRDVEEGTDKELFYAILGGSPGNFGIITHYLVEVFRADKYVGTVAGPNGFKGPHGIKGLWVYSPKVLKKLLTAIAAMGEKGDTPRNYDLCVSVLSTDFPITQLFPTLNDASTWEHIQNKIKGALADEFLEWLNGRFPAVIVLYAQWCPITPQDRYDKTVEAWFDQFRELDGLFENETLVINELEEDMSKMTGEWLFKNEREFDLPYVKRTYATNSTTLVKDNWPEQITKRIDLIYNPDQLLKGKPGEKDYEVFLKCKLSVQIQCFGGKHSQFYLNGQKGSTAYSWRDSTVVQTTDIFHDDDAEAKAYAVAWQQKNDAILIGPSGCFSEQDRRLLWGSYGDWDLGKEEVWRCYFDSEEQYQRIGVARGKADPHGTFTANPFAVKAITAPGMNGKSGRVPIVAKAEATNGGAANGH